MLTPITMAKFKLTLGATAYENLKVKNAKVIRNENGFDIATIQLDDTTLYPDPVTSGTAIKLEVGEKGSAYPTNPMFKGKVFFPIVELGCPSTLTLSCLGSGYGFGQMLVGAEYGAQSKHPTNVDLSSIIAGPNWGIVDKYVEKVLSTGINSGFTYDTANVTIQGDDPDIQHISFPYKPANQCLNDLMDLITALRDDVLGSHWIVTTDDKLRVKQVTETQVGWTLFYGGDDNVAEQATLTYGENYDLTNFEKVGPEANYVLYYGVWRKPSNGDSWTNGGSGDWVVTGLARAAITDDAAVHKVGTESIKLYTTADDNGGTWWVFPPLPSSPWDLETAFSPLNIPYLNFYAMRGAGMSQAKVWALTSDPAIPDWDDRFEYNIFADMSATNTWYHFSLPCGDYVPEGSSYTTPKWSTVGSPLWSHIHGLGFYALCPAATHGQLWIDGLYIGGAHVARAAYNHTISPFCMKLITDDVGKDDTLLASDDSGIMAQMAKAELLRQQKTCYLGWTHLKGIIPEALPGQWFYQQANVKSTKIVQEITQKGFYTTLYLTDDLTNGRARMRYEDLNKVYADVRPEFQDRQASSIKAGQVNLDVPVLAVDYA